MKILCTSILEDLIAASMGDTTITAASFRDVRIEAMNILVSLDKAAASEKKEAARNFVLSRREIQLIKAEIADLQDKRWRLYEEVDFMGASLSFLDLRLYELKIESKELKDACDAAEAKAEATHAEGRR